jgi:Metallo-peptidase family M12B Reprolysin-like
LAPPLQGPPTHIPGEAWTLPLLVTSRSERPDVVGITFDTGEAQLGRVSAVFYRSLLARLAAAGAAAFSREYLFTVAHELGHLFGLPHAWEPFGGVGEPERSATALTFMNYPQLYRLGSGRFYRDFRFRFRPEEALHLRHGPWPAVFPRAALPSREGALAEPMFLLAPRRRTPLALELRAPGGGEARLRFAEPVHLEVRLANRSRRRVAVPADAVDAEGGRLEVLVEREGGDGKAPPARWAPVVERDRTGGRLMLGGRGRRGEPSYALYGSVDLTYGRDGFAFREPGRYRLTAVTTQLDGRRLASAPLSVEIAPPERTAAAAAGDLFSAEMGRALAFGGDPGGAALDRLRDVVERGAPAGLVPRAALRLGEAAARPFRRPWRRTVAAAQPETAMRRLEQALGAARQLGMAFPNPVRSHLLALQADCATRAGRAAAATAALEALHGFLAATVVHNRRLRARLLADARRLARTLRRAP